MAEYATLTPKQLIDEFEYAVANKWGYIWGTAGVMWTQAKQEAMNKTTDSDRAMGRQYGSKWIGHYVADCSGLFSWAFKKHGSYMYHGSNTMYNSYCTSKGTLVNGKRSDGKELKPGTAVFTYNKKKDNYGHVGLYIGGGIVIEAEGTKAGVIKSKVTNSKWTYWGELKHVNYYNGDSIQFPAKETPVSSTVTYPTLRQGTKGDLVYQMQSLLSKLGSNLEVDGIFGSGTRSAVQAFQRKYGLEVDGICGPQTWNKLLSEACNIQTTTVQKTDPKVYTVTISKLTKEQADEIVKKYGGNITVG